MAVRKEKDLLGQRNVPDNAYWGIHTLRAEENFSGLGKPIDFSFIQALAMVKKAACLANYELGYLAKDVAEAINCACDEIIEGNLVEQFPLPALQGGAGTSTNMNINEVIANRALELLGKKKGEYNFIHPLNQVNLHQSTNDVYPSALKIAVMYKLKELEKKIILLQSQLQKKEKEYAYIIKIGRTEMQEAVPMTVGQEWSAWAEAIARDRWRIFKCLERLRVLNIGGTAIGTGLTAPRSYIYLVIEKLREITQLGIMRSENCVDATANMDVLVEVFGIISAHASNIAKLSNDLRLLNLLGEIILPALQAGSSIMPAKVNPVILEAAIQVGLKVLSHNYLVNQAISQSTLQICEFLPLVADSFMESLNLLININTHLANFLPNISIAEKKVSNFVWKSPTILTCFLPYINYEQLQALAKQFPNNSSEQEVRRWLNDKFGEELVKKVLTGEYLLSLGYREQGEENAQDS